MVFLWSSAVSASTFHLSTRSEGGGWLQECDEKVKRGARFEMTEVEHMIPARLKPCETCFQGEDPRKAVAS